MTTLRVQSEPLGGSALVAARISKSTPAGWYADAPRDAAEWRIRADEVRKEPGLARWFTALEPAFNASGAALERLRNSERGSGVVVTTGQQPGLFGGPMYALSKALSALALADELQRVTGVPVAPVFWAATDDADIAEASVTTVGMTGGAKVVRHTPAAPPGTSLANVTLGDIGEAFAEFAQAAGSGSHAKYMELVRQAYEPTATVGDAYVALMRGLLEELGIAVLDASHPAVRDAADGVLRRALQSAAELDSALQQRNAAIADAGFEPQVGLVRGLSLVFGTEQGIKRRLPISEATAASSESPRGLLSPNVLLRPVVERAILPTVAYLAGPGELAYFAQVSAVAATLGAAVPLALPRWSGTVIEPHVGRLLEKYHLRVNDLRDPHAAETRFAREAMPATVSGTIAFLRKDIEARIGTLLGAAPSDSLLPEAVLKGAGRTLQHRVDRLERRLMAAQKRRSDAAMSDIATARGSLYPNGKRQERALNPLPILARHGSLVIEKMLEGAAEHAVELVHGEPEPATREKTTTASSRGTL